MTKSDLARSLISGFVVVRQIRHILPGLTGINYAIEIVYAIILGILTFAILHIGMIAEQWRKRQRQVH